MSDEFDVDYRTEPSRYRHWRLTCEGAIATLRRAPDYCDGSTLAPPLVTEWRTSSAVFTTFAGSGA